MSMPFGAYYAPQQVQQARGFGEYYAPSGLSAYYTPGGLQGLGANSGGFGGIALRFAINGLAGWLVGKHLGAPVATAIGSAIFGFPAMAVAAFLTRKGG